MGRGGVPGGAVGARKQRGYNHAHTRYIDVCKETETTSRSGERIGEAACECVCVYIVCVCVCGEGRAGPPLQERPTWHSQGTCAPLLFCILLRLKSLLFRLFFS